MTDADGARDSAPGSDRSTSNASAEGADSERAAAGRIDRLDATYRDEIETWFDDPAETRPEASVVVVTYRTPAEAFEELLSALDAQSAGAFEVVVVDNGTAWDAESAAIESDRVTAYAELRRNRGVTFGRNLGAALAVADVLVFVDDDAVPGPRFVEAHLDAHDGDVVAARGRVLPIEDSLYNRLQSWYDLGDEVIPYFLNTEGNASVDREAFRAVSGFDERLGGRAGHEGIDLTYRLLRSGYDREQVLYVPDAVVHHDNAADLRSYLKKRAVGKHYRAELAARRPEVFEFARTYSPPDRARERRGRLDRVAAIALDAAARIGCSLFELRRRFDPSSASDGR